MAPAVGNLKKKKEEVVDSWEDEEMSDSEPGDDQALKNVPEPKTPTVSSLPSAPPPTPLTASGPGASWDTHHSAEASSSSARNDGKRPEKTDAVARRLIAAGLGIKAPKQTEEQVAYQKSVKEQEKKKRDLEREGEKQQQEAKERAKAAIWDN